MRSDYTKRRTIIRLNRILKTTLHVSRCKFAECPRFDRPYRPELEGRLALSGMKFGLDVMHYVTESSRSFTIHQIHHDVSVLRGLPCSKRTVATLVDRFEALPCTPKASDLELRHLLQNQRCLVLDISLQGTAHLPLYWLRECISGTTLLAGRSESSGDFDRDLELHLSRLVSVLAPIRERLKGVIMDPNLRDAGFDDRFRGLASRSRPIPIIYADLVAVQ